MMMIAKNAHFLVICSLEIVNWIQLKKKNIKCLVNIRDNEQNDILLLRWARSSETMANRVARDKRHRI